MKRTHTLKTGAGCSFVKIKFRIDADIIERAIMKIIDTDMKSPTRQQVETQIRNSFTYYGTGEFLGEGFFDADNWYHELPLLQSNSEEYARKLFPDYYVIKQR